MEKKEKTLEELIKEGMTLEQISELVEKVKEEQKKEDAKAKELVEARKNCANAVITYLGMLGIKATAADLYKMLLDLEKEDTISKSNLERLLKLKNNLTKYGANGIFLDWLF